MKIIKKLLCAVLAASVISSLTACNSAKSGDALSSSSGGRKAVTVYHVALSGSTRPFNYFDDKNQLTGYEVDMLKKIDSLLPEVSFDFTTTKFESLFAGLDSGKFDLIANNITDKPERRQKYLFSESAYFYNHTIIATRKDTTNIKTLTDLAGQSIPVGAGTATDIFLQNYNKQNSSKAIKEVYVDGDAAPNIIAMYEGRYNAVIYSKSYVDLVEKQYGYQFNIYSIPNETDIQNPAVYILFSQGNAKLKKEVDGALNTMKKDGSLAKLCIKYFGSDDTKSKDNTSTSSGEK